MFNISQTINHIQAESKKHRQDIINLSKSFSEIAPKKMTQAHIDYFENKSFRLRSLCRYYLFILINKGAEINALSNSKTLKDRTRSISSILQTTYFNCLQLIAMVEDMKQQITPAQSSSIRPSVSTNYNIFNPIKTHHPTFDTRKEFGYPKK